MKKWFNRFQAWRAQRRQFSPEKWERIRAKGKARFVFRSALQFMLLMIVVIGTTEFFQDGIQLYDFRFWIVGGPIVGIFSGVLLWWDQEMKYKNARP